MSGVATGEEALAFFLELDASARAAQDGDERALDRMTRFAYAMAWRIVKKTGWFVPGGDARDIVQTGMFGYLKALRNWRADSGTPFAVYCRLNVYNDIITALKLANRQKYYWQNHARSLDEPLRYRGSHSVMTLGDLIPAKEPGLGDNLAEEEQTSDIRTALQSHLTELEWAALDGLYYRSASYADLSLELGRSRKSIDNARTRGLEKARWILSNVELANGGEIAGEGVNGKIGVRQG